jgi:anti-anti-sigma factor
MTWLLLIPEASRVVEATVALGPEGEWHEGDGTTPFACVVSFVEGGAAVVVRGEVDLETAPVLLGDLRTALAASVPAVSVDLGQVTFLDSSGIRALLLAGREAWGRGITFGLAEVSAAVRLVIEAAGLSDTLHIVEE